MRRGRLPRWLCPILLPRVCIYLLEIVTSVENDRRQQNVEEQLWIKDRLEDKGSSLAVNGMAGALHAGKQKEAQPRSVGMTITATIVGECGKRTRGCEE